MSATVLCVDPENESREATVTALRGATGWEVVACADLAAAVAALGPDVDCVVSEFDLPDGSGLDLLAAVREQTPDAGFVLFTDADPAAIETTALSGAVSEYVPKSGPNARDRLVDLVAHTVTFRNQTAYPLPRGEGERVAVLDAYRPVLAAVEPTFERLSSLGSALLDAPMAVFGIIDEREEEFLGCFGVDFDILPREDTICTYALLEPGVTAISDVDADPRFEGREEFDTQGLRAYASANLTTPDGHVIGTFCVYDDAPREWSEADRQHLEALAAEAMEALELRRRLHEAEDAADPPPDIGDQQIVGPAASTPAPDSLVVDDDERGGEAR
jgi:GAF domain-containing protein